MSTSNASAASSRQCASTPGRASRVTTAVRSPRWSSVSTMAPPNRRRSSSRIATRSVPLRLGGDLVLQLHEAVDHRLGAGRTARNVDVDGDDRVDALHGGVVVVEAAGARAHAEGDDPLRLGHLVVDALEDRRHLVADRPHHEQHVSLARREPRQPRAEAVDVVVRARGGHVLHPAARRHERVLEDGIFPGPADGFVELAREEPAYSHSRPPFRQMYPNPSIRMPRNTSISTKPNQPSWRDSMAHGQTNRSSISTRMKKMAIVENLIANFPSATSMGSLPHSNGSAFTRVGRRGAIRLGSSTSAPATSAEMAKTISIGAYVIVAGASRPAWIEGGLRKALAGSDTPVQPDQASRPRASSA